MEPRINPDVRLGGRLFEVFRGTVLLGGGLMVTGCIMLGGYAALIQPDLFTSLLICAAVLTAAITGYRVPYYRSALFGARSTGKRAAERSPAERIPAFSAMPQDDRTMMPNCPTSVQRPNNGLGVEPMLDAAVDRIIRGMDRELEIGR